MTREYVPDYVRIADDIAVQIEDGRLPAGTQLPTALALAARYHVSRGTIDRAMIRLRTLGLIEGRPGRGVYVAGGSDAVGPDE